MVSPEIESPTTSRTPADTRSATESTNTDATGLKGRATQIIETEKARAIQWTGGVQDGIRERPVRSVLIAAAAGAVIGLIVGRRSR